MEERGVEDERQREANAGKGMRGGGDTDVCVWVCGGGEDVGGLMGRKQHAILVALKRSNVFRFK